MSEKYAFIEAEHATVAGETACAPTVTQMCGWLNFTSGFYEWRSRRGQRGSETQERALKLLIAKAFEDSDGTYGYRRVALQLARWGVRAELELVRALDAGAGPGGLPAAALAAVYYPAGPGGPDPRPRRPAISEGGVIMSGRSSKPYAGKPHAHIEKGMGKSDRTAAPEPLTTNAAR